MLDGKPMGQAETERGVMVTLAEHSPCPGDLSQACQLPNLDAFVCPTLESKRWLSP